MCGETVLWGRPATCNALIWRHVGEATEYLACPPASWGRSPSHLTGVLSHSLFKILGLQVAEWTIMQKWLPFSEGLGRPCENGTCTEDPMHPEIMLRFTNAAALALKKIILFPNKLRLFWAASWTLAIAFWFSHFLYNRECWKYFPCKWTSLRNHKCWDFRLSLQESESAAKASSNVEQTYTKSSWFQWKYSICSGDCVHRSPWNSTLYSCMYAALAY